MREKVISFIEQHQLLRSAEEIVVGFSGGADSLCLLHLLSTLTDPGERFAGLKVRAAHLNHMWRGEESETDAQQAVELAANLGIACAVGRVDVPALAKEEKRSLEETSRSVRYHFLREQAAGNLIAVAHQADDQVETLLLHWLRGSGLTGMIGMLPRQQDLIRPLLCVSRAEILTYCREHGLVPLEDQSNADLRFVRNRLRHEIIPVLREINPGLQETLQRNAEVARVDLAWLEEQVDDIWPTLANARDDNSIELNVPALLALPLSLRHHVFRRATAKLCKGQSPLEPRHLFLLDSLLETTRDYRERFMNLPQIIQVMARKNTLTLYRNIITFLPDHQIKPVSGPVPEQKRTEAILPIPGSCRVPGTHHRAVARVIENEYISKTREAILQHDWEAVRHYLPPELHDIGQHSFLFSQDSILLDADSLGKNVLVRTWKSGDRIHPLGMRGTKKVHDIFVDNHVPRSQRTQIPLFFKPNECVWVAGHSIGENVKITRDTQSIVCIWIEQV